MLTLCLNRESIEILELQFSFDEEWYCETDNNVGSRLISDELKQGIKEDPVD
jgi:hypothetical protein